MKHSIVGRTTSSESIFTYQPGTSHSTYQHSGFTPNFTASNSNEAVSLCGSNADCLFDYSITGKTALALGSKTAVESYSVAVEDTVKGTSNIIQTIQATSIPGSIMNSVTFQISLVL